MNARRGNFNSNFTCIIVRETPFFTRHTRPRVRIFLLIMRPPSSSHADDLFRRKKQTILLVKKEQNNNKKLRGNDPRSHGWHTFPFWSSCFLAMRVWYDSIGWIFSDISNQYLFGKTVGQALFRDVREDLFKKRVDPLKSAFYEVSVPVLEHFKDRRSVFFF